MWREKKKDAGEREREVKTDRQADAEREGEND